MTRITYSLPWTRSRSKNKFRAHSRNHYTKTQYFTALADEFCTSTFIFYVFFLGTGAECWSPGALRFWNSPPLPLQGMSILGVLECWRVGVQHSGVLESSTPGDAAFFFGGGGALLNKKTGCTSRSPGLQQRTSLIILKFHHTSISFQFC